jgi:hypothetical protein
MLVPLSRLPHGVWREAEPRPIRLAATPSYLVVVIEPDALLRPVLVDALRASLDATVVEVESLDRLSRLARTFTPDLLVVDPNAADALGELEQRMPVLFTDVPPRGSAIQADRYAVLPRPFQLEDFVTAADRLRTMQPV